MTEYVPPANKATPFTFNLMCGDDYWFASVNYAFINMLNNAQCSTENGNAKVVQYAYAADGKCYKLGGNYFKASCSSTWNATSIKVEYCAYFNLF